MKVLLTGLILAASLAGAATAGGPAVRVGRGAARAAALRLRPGEVQKAELEWEKGGSGRRWSFDIRTASGVFEVGIDAVTGRVLENGPA